MSQCLVYHCSCPSKVSCCQHALWGFKHPSTTIKLNINKGIRTSDDNTTLRLHCTHRGGGSSLQAPYLRCSCSRTQDAPHRNSTPLLLPLLQGVSSQACFFRLQTTQRQPPKHQSYQQHSFPPKHEAVSTFDSRQQQGRMLL